MELIPRRTIMELEGEEGFRHLDEYSDSSTERGKKMRDAICNETGQRLAGKHVVHKPRILVGGKHAVAVYDDPLIYISVNFPPWSSLHSADCPFMERGINCGTE